MSVLEAIMQFSFATVPSLLCAPGALSRVVEFPVQRRLKRILLVADPGVVEAGLAEGLCRSFDEAGLEYSVFSEFDPEPGEAVITAAYRQARDTGAQMVVGMGGGSAMDVAKLAAYFADSAETLRQIIGENKTRGRRLPLVLIPTTAGTGSEATPVAVVRLADLGTATITSPVLLPDLAVLDGRLTLSLPPAVTAQTGVDAMVHAIEASSSRMAKNPVSDALAQQALQLLHGNIRTAFRDGANEIARSNMLLGACLAGMAFANAPLGGVHALAHPLGTCFQVPHGLSSAVVLTEVLRFNRPVAEKAYADIGRLLAGCAMPDETACDFLIDTLDALLLDLGIDRRLATYGVSASDVDRLAEQVVAQESLLQHNPRDLTRADARGIYERRLETA